MTKIEIFCPVAFPIDESIGENIVSGNNNLKIAQLPKRIQVL